MKRSLPILLAVTFLSLPAPAHAFEDSTRRPFYVQGALGSFSYWPVLFQSQAYWRPDVEFGYHFSGRHDGFVLGIRQAFDVGRDVYSGGQTLLRGGWDFALPFRNGRFELTLAPYGTAGVNYIFQNLQAGFHASIGFDAKLFFFEGLYVLVRPIELGLGQFVNLGPFAQNVYFNFSAGIGIGYAF